MNGFVILFIVALIVSAIGFKKYVWFISIGYGFSVAAIGLMLLYLYAARADAGSRTPPMRLSRLSRSMLRNSSMISAASASGW